MREARSVKRKKANPGMRALEACGDGFWEFDLLDGSAWFSDWFYKKLAWAPDVKRTTFAELQQSVQPRAWEELMSKFRDHLERGLALDLEIEVRAAGNIVERWRMRGTAQRNGAGQPVYLAGSMRDVNADPRASEISCLLSLRAAFAALPVAAALLDSRADVLEANRLWQEFADGTAAQAIARLRAANSQTAIEFWLDQGEGFEAGARQLRVRAIAFQHDGSRHLVVTLEDRRSD